MIRAVGKFAHLSRAQQREVIEASVICAAARVLLATMSYRAVDALTNRVARRAVHRSTGSNSTDIDRLVYAINAAGRFVPGARNCLVRAISAKAMLGMRGCASQIHFGVAREADSELGAHAWLESGGRVVIGGFENGRYAPLLPRHCKD